MAIHTNASSNERARGIQVMYPPARYGDRTKKSIAACEAIAAELKKIYDLPDKVFTREYSATETNTCPGAGVYLELGYGNTNKKDAAFVHDNVEKIACALADGIENWKLGIKPEEPEQEEVKPEEPKEEYPDGTVYVAQLNKSYVWTFNLWSDTKKSKSLAVVKHGKNIYILSEEQVNGYYYAQYDGKVGYVNPKYITIVDKPAAGGRIARKKSSYIWNLNLWKDNRKSESLASIKHGVDIIVLSKEPDEKGYYECRYQGKIGFVDSRYIYFK